MAYFDEDSEGEDGIYKYAITIGSIGIVSLLLYGTLVGLLYLKNHWNKRNFKKVKRKVEELTFDIEKEVSEESDRLAAMMVHVDDKLEKSRLDRMKYTENLLFRHGRGENHPIFRKDPKEEKVGYYENCMFKFEELLYEKEFLITFVNVMEESEKEAPRDAFEMASYMVLTLLDSLEYTMYILKRIIGRRIKKVLQSDDPCNLLPNHYGVVERLITTLIGICMYDHMQNVTNPALFRLYHAVRFYVEMGMVDSVTAESEHTFSHNRVSNYHIDGKILTLRVSLGCEPIFNVDVNNQDSINQVKTKVIYWAYKNYPHSELPSIDQFDLVWRKEDGTTVLLLNEDESCVTVSGWKQFNNLAHYEIESDIEVSLLHRVVKGCFTSQATKGASGDPAATKHKTKEEHEMTAAEILEYSKEFKDNERKMLMTHEYNCLLNRFFHLARGDDDYLYNVQKRRECPAKYYPEKSMRNVLKTRAVLQKYINELLAAISDVSTVPAVVKWLFDFFDEQVRKHDIKDPSIVKEWRCQTVGRFWEHVVSNPNVIFDVDLRNDIKFALQIIGSDFIKAGYDDEVTPATWSTHKVISEMDLQEYRTVFQKYYSDINASVVDPVGNFFDELSQISELYRDRVDALSVLKELYYYVTKNRLKLLNTLSEDPAKRDLKYKLLSVSLPSWCEAFDAGMSEEDILKKLQLLCNKEPKGKKKKKKKDKKVFNPTELFAGGDLDAEKDSDLDDIFDDDILLHKDDKKAAREAYAGDSKQEKMKQDCKRAQEESFIEKARRFADRSMAKSADERVQKLAEEFAEMAQKKKW